MIIPTSQGNHRGLPLQFYYSDAMCNFLPQRTQRLRRSTELTPKSHAEAFVSFAVKKLKVAHCVIQN